MNRLICAEMPEELTDLSSPEDQLYCKTVQDNMIHKCSDAINGCIDKNGGCRRGYKNEERRPLTTLDENGYPTYRRRTVRDLKVVPHNRQIILEWEGHMNVEYAGSSYTVLYLYKYLFKGNKKVKARILSMGLTENDLKDEILIHIRGRVICAMDSMWRFFGFHTYPVTKPSCVKITIKLPPHVDKLLEDHKLSDLTVYFARPESIFGGYTYTRFIHHFSYDKNLPARFRNDILWTEGGDVEFDENHICVDISYKFPFLVNKNKHLYLFSKDPSKQKSIVRMHWLYPDAGELFYLRILMYHNPAMSFVEYRTHQGIEYKTFQESAVARGHVRDANEAIFAFLSIMLISSPAELRAFLVMMTADGFPTLAIIQNEEYFEMLYQDFLHDPVNNGSVPLSKNKCLLDLKRRFEKIGKDMMEACGFPLPENDVNMSELERLMLMYDPAEQAALLETAQVNYPNTEEQEEVFQLVKNALDSETRLILFIQGSAGTGKSTFANKATAYARSKNLIALGCCANALACQVYGQNGEYTTTHDLFGIPVIEDNEDIDHEAEIKSLYRTQAAKLEVLLAARLIVWDEALSNHKHCLSAAFDLMERFAGKVLIMMGDWRQCPPVVKNAEMNEIVNASMFNSRFWNQVTVRFFTVNLRLMIRKLSVVSADAQSQAANVAAAEVFNKEQREYLQMIDIIGDGRQLNEETSNFVIDINSENIPIDGSRTIALPKIEKIFDQRAAIDWLYTDGLFNPETMHKRAILCSTNVMVDEWNSVIQSMNENPLREYLSTDTVREIDDPNGILASMLTESVMARYDVPGVPNHILRLKEDDICMVMRNLNRKEGLAKNLRVRIVKMYDHVIRVCTLDPERPKYYNIPRIRFSVSLPYGRAVKIERKQFPLRLAYSMTFNKSQGQEFEKVLVDIRNNPFTHGHLYVALSRIRVASNIRVFTEPPSDGDDEFSPPTVTNVVFEKLRLG